MWPSATHVSRTDDLPIIIKGRDLKKPQGSRRCQENFSGAGAARSDDGKGGDEEQSSAAPSRDSHPELTPLPGAASPCD